MEKGIALLATLVLGPVLAPSLAGASTSPRAAAAVTGAAGASGASRHCHTSRVKLRVRRWAWVAKTHWTHGQRVLLRSRGKTVYMHVRVWRTRTAVHLLCAPTAPAAAAAPLPQVANPTGSPSPSAWPASEVVAAPPQPPTGAGPPTISGDPRQGQTLNASPGGWTGSPMAFSYEWMRCDSADSCTPVAGAIAGSYTLTEADVGSTVRVVVTALNGVGPSAPASSAETPVVGSASAPVSHLEYVLRDGTTYVYDMDHELTLLATLALPQTSAGVRGVAVAPAKHLMFISFGGDGGGTGSGSVLAYDLVAEKVVWEVPQQSGIDSSAVSPDGEKLYVPTGENTESGIWDVRSTTTGLLTATVQGGAGAHNTIASRDGRYVYLGGRNHNFLDVYETATGMVKEVGPLAGGVRPFTVNGSNSLAFTTATGFAGFQVSSIATGNVLFTQSFGEVPSGVPFSAPSHGISISPDERQLYVIDAVRKQVQFWDVSGISQGLAPTQVAVLPVAGLSGNESSPCAYDCGRDGWLQLSRDGQLLFVGDSGEVIETATRKVLTTLPALADTRKSIEVDWQRGVPVATSGRSGVGYVP